MSIAPKEFSVLSELTAARKQVRSATYAGIGVGILLVTAAGALIYLEISDPGLHVRNGVGDAQFAAIAVFLLLGSFILGLSLNNLKPGLFKVQITPSELVDWYNPRKPRAKRQRWDSPTFRVVLTRDEWMGDAAGWRESKGILDSYRLNEPAGNAILEAAKEAHLSITVRHPRGWGGMRTVTVIGPRPGQKLGGPP
jgi:hypothetical protein